MKALCYKHCGKRLFDLGKVLLCLAVLIRAKLRNPIFFHQTRLGLHGRPFQLLKFRTMHDAVDAQGSPLPDAKRLTPFGRWLRATSPNKLLEFSGVLHAFVGQPVFFSDN